MRRRKIFKQDVQQTHFSKVDVLDIDIPFNSLAISSIITAEDQFRNTKHSCSSTITTTDIQNGKASSKLLGDSFSKASNIQRALTLGCMQRNGKYVGTLQPHLRSS
ncbi:hypothetical protein C359_02646 [Cryptococcus neoformans Bt120]|nr:hypothetical protein C360_04699 [Cryptococcus neoformans var. grubii Bt15]OXG42058.1 hypothetical protein C359_02646 [Cryptococcus neoformans var. grubii Bt120]